MSLHLSVFHYYICGCCFEQTTNKLLCIKTQIHIHTQTLTHKTKKQIPSQKFQKFVRLPFETEGQKLTLLGAKIVRLGTPRGKFEVHISENQML